MATFAQRITELIGSDYSTIAANSNADLFNAAVSEIADLAPPELLLKYAVNPADLDENTPTWTSVGGKKVLLVTRLDASSPRLAQECKPVSIQDFEKAKDANSIYLATKYNPVYAYITDAGATALTILPEPIVHEDVKVYYFAYPTTDITGNSNLDGLPNEVEQAVILKACINILQAYISDFVQEEEDSEMQGMIAGQIQSLTGQYQSELARFTEQDATPRGE
tara:strand:+ start:457 stop:1125 length:669 start_codon:yes stop_codon:yes gene_type:complete